LVIYTFLDLNDARKMEQIKTMQDLVTLS